MSRLTGALLTLLVLLFLASPALAGGWATVRLDTVPEGVAAEKAWHVGFMVLQHDQTPNSDVTPLVRAVHRESGLEATATGQQEGAVGHFVADLTLPESGAWKWEIEPAPFAATSFPTLQVLDAAAEDATERGEAQSAGARSGLPAASATIEMSDGWLFQPARLEAAPGTTVSWLNRSPLVHSVSVDDLAFDDSGLIEPGQSFSMTFEEPGTYHYRCSPHPGMEGTIVIA